MGKLIDIRSKEEFQNAIKDTCFVDFYAEWCRPCMSMMSTIETLAEQTLMNVAKVDIETNHHLAMDMGVKSVPCLIIFKEGKEVFRKNGVMQLPDIMREYGKINATE